MTNRPVSRLGELEEQQRNLEAEIKKERHREVNAQLRDAFRRLADDDDLDTFDIIYRTLCGWAGNLKAQDAASVSEFAERLTKAIATRS